MSSIVDFVVAISVEGSGVVASRVVSIIRLGEVEDRLLSRDE